MNPLAGNPTSGTWRSHHCSSSRIGAGLQPHDLPMGWDVSPWSSVPEARVVRPRKGGFIPPPVHFIPKDRLFKGMAPHITAGSGVEPSSGFNSALQHCAEKLRQKIEPGPCFSSFLPWGKSRVGGVPRDPRIPGANICAGARLLLIFCWERRAKKFLPNRYFLNMPRGEGKEGKKWKEGNGEGRKEKSCGRDQSNLQFGSCLTKIWPGLFV